MLLQGSRTPIKGSDHTLKISISNHSTWTTDYSPIKSKFEKKKLIKMLLQGLGVLSHFENFYVGPQHLNDWLDPDQI